MSTVGKRHGRFRRLWGAPIVLAMLSVVGLIAALVGDGMMDAISYALLAVPLVVIVWYIVRRTR